MAFTPTHGIVSWAIWRFLCWVIGVSFSAWDVVSVAFFGIVIDLDHFLSWTYTKDFLKRLWRMVFKGGDLGVPSKGTKLAFEIFHTWLAIPLILLYLFVVKFILNASVQIWIPFLFWFVHYWLIDRFQRNNRAEDLPYPYRSFFAPIVKKKWVRNWGYPPKPRIEVMGSSIIFLLLIGFEIWFNFFR